PESFDLEFSAANPGNADEIFKQAEVSISVDDVLLEAWNRGGQKSVHLRRRNHVFTVTGDHASLQNLQFGPKEMGMAYVQYNFLTDKVTDQDNFVIHAIQRLSSTGAVFGGETYAISKSQRPLFYAGTDGDKAVDKDEAITIIAENINEPADYNWYDEEGNLI